MKKITGILISLFFVSFIFVSCNQNNVEEQIVGKWSIKSAELMNLDALVEQMSKLGGLTDVDIDQFKQSLDADMKDEFNDASFDFLKDGSLILSGTSESATWKYDKDNNKIIINEGDMISYDFIIKELKGKKLKAELKMSQNGFDFEIKMDLEKE